MANIVEITVKSRDEATQGLDKVKSQFSAAGDASGKGFTTSLGRAMGTGALGGIFGGRSGGSILQDAQRQGQQAGMGFSRGLLQRFQTSMGTGLLSAFFGYSSGNKLFSSAGNTVIQDAQHQGVNIAQGFSKGLTAGLEASGSQMSDFLKGLFGGAGGGQDLQAGQQSGTDFGKGFTGSIRNTLASFRMPSIGGSGDDESSGEKAGTDFARGFTKAITDTLSKFSVPVPKDKSGGSASASLSAGPATVGLAQGIGPGILGMGGIKTAIGGALASALATLPALAGAAGTGIGGALIAAMAAGAIAGSPKLKADFAGILNNIKQVFTSTSVVGPFIDAMGKALGGVPAFIKSLAPQIAGIFKTISPQIAGIFTGVESVIRNVLTLMRAAAPALGPVISGLLTMVNGILPGITVAVKAFAPFVAQFAGFLGQLGKDLGAFFSDAAPAMNASMQVLGALLNLVGGLLPVIMKLAGAFATALAPALTQIANGIRTLSPIFSIIGNILASLAGAILGDIVAAFSAFSGILKAVEPALAAFGTAVSKVFTLLENSGVFATLGDALENLVGPIGKLIDALLNGLTPIIPPLIQFFTQISGILIGAFSSALSAIIPPLTDLVTRVLAGLREVLPTILPLLSALFGIFTNSIVATINIVAKGLDAIIKAIPPSVLGTIVTGILAVVAAIKIWSVVQAALDVLLSANPLGLLVLAIAAVVGAIVELVAHWNTVWGAISSTADTVWKWIVSNVLDPMKTFFTQTIPSWFKACINFLTNDFVHPFENGFKDAWSWVTTNVLNPIDTFFTRTIVNWYDTSISFLRSHFATPFQNVISGAWSWVVSHVWDPMDTLITRTIPGWWDSAVNAIGDFWDRVEGIVRKPVAWVVDNVFIPLSDVFDDITNALGLGKPIKISAMAEGGRVPGGYGGGDSRLILAEPGEAVVSKDKARQYAPLLAAMGVPGFQLGGLISAVVNAGAAALGDIIPGLNVLGSLIKGVNIVSALSKFASLGTGGAAGELGEIISAMPKMVIKDMESWIGGHAKPAPTLGTSQLVAGGTIYVPGGSIQALMKAMAAARGWTGPEWTALYDVEMAEAGFNMTATNPSSGAYGLAQFINGPSEYYQYGGNPNTAAGQITAMLNYIAQRYGDPEMAWLHEQEYHWYQGGGPASGWAVVGEHGKELVRLPRGSYVYPSGQIPAALPGGGPYGPLQIEIIPGGNSAFEQFMVTALKRWVVIRGGGNVQKAFGRH